MNHAMQISLWNYEGIVLNYILHMIENIMIFFYDINENCLYSISYKVNHSYE